MKFPFFKHKLKTKKEDFPCIKNKCISYPVCRCKETISCTPLWDYLLPLYSDISLYDMDKDYKPALKQTLPKLKTWGAD